MQQLDLASEIELSLLTNGFNIRNSDPVQHGHKLQLWVGPSIIIYNRGTVLVQERLYPKHASCKRKLERILPEGTRWQLEP